MRYLRIPQADEVYQRSGSPDVRMDLVHFPEMYELSKGVHRLERALGETARDDFWSPVARSLKLLRFDLSAAPLTAAATEEYCEAVISSVEGPLKRSALLYPSLASLPSLLMESLTKLARAKAAPLLDRIEALLGAGSPEGFALLICEPRLIPRVREGVESISNLVGLEILGSADLRAEVRYRMVIAVGAPQWFPEHIFTAPRARETRTLAYSWLCREWSPKQAFVAPLVVPTSTHAFSVEFLGREADGEIGDVDSLVPFFDFDFVVSRAIGEASGVVATEGELAEARLYVLEGGWATLLDASEDSSILVIDLDEDVKDRVKRVPVDEIEPGMFLVLRTGGGGDYIIPIADRILGDFAAIAREHQGAWKARLRERVRHTGIASVVDELRALGSARAREVNVRNWMSGRNIRTQDFSDFDAVMRLVGLKDEAGEYWSIMEAIDAAHRKAGFYLRRLLLDEVGKIDMLQLEQEGMMTIELRDKDAGSLGLFQVRAISPKVVTVPTSKVGEPFKVDHYGKDVPTQRVLWHEEPGRS